VRVVTASLHLVRQDLVHEFQTSSHRKSWLDHVLVRLVDADGVEGWGEIASAAAPYYNPETVETCWTIAQEFLLPALLGARWEHPDEAAATWSKVRGNAFARAGVDMAVWALWSRARGESLARALGGEPTIDALVEQVAAQVAAGYPRVKLKIQPGWDVEPVRAVRAAFGDLDLHVDANGAYTEAEEHLAALRALDDHRLTMIEQPFAPRELLAHARLQRTVSTPVCLDESVETLADLALALELGSGRVLNIKVSRMGGLGPARAAHDLARRHGMPVWCGGMHEFGIGRAANVALSSLPGFTLPSDVSGSDKYYARDVVVPPVAADHGIVPVPTGPGLGHEVDRGWLAERTRRTIELRAS
jgi:O-succinylbenzoate synthase